MIFSLFFFSPEGLNTFHNEWEFAGGEDEIWRMRGYVARTKWDGADGYDEVEMGVS